MPMPISKRNILFKYEIINEDCIIIQMKKVNRNSFSKILFFKLNILQFCFVQNHFFSVSCKTILAHWFWCKVRRSRNSRSWELEAILGTNHFYYFGRFFISFLYIPGTYLHIYILDRRTRSNLRTLQERFYSFVAPKV